MADKLTITVALESTVATADKDSRTARLLAPAVELAHALSIIPSTERAVNEIAIHVHDGTATVKFERPSRHPGTESGY